MSVSLIAGEDVNIPIKTIFKTNGRMMDTISRKIWNKEFTLPITFDVYEGESVLPIQREALDKILENWDIIDGTHDSVINYCIKTNPEEKSFIEANDIFVFVKPIKLFIKHNEENRVVALLCDYRFNLEDGIAVVFKDEKLKEIGPQYCIL